MYINESGNYTLSDQKVYGKEINGYKPILYMFEDTDQSKVYAYCIDIKVMPQYNSFYSAMNLSEFPKKDLEEMKKNCIRNILLNSYPYIDIQKIMLLSNIQNITMEECISATQLSVWSNSDAKSYNWDLVNHPDQALTKQLYDWYMSLPPISPTDKIARLEIKPIMSDLNVDISYKADRNNYDSSKIEPSYKFEPQVTSRYLGVDKDGYHHVLAINPPSNVTFTVNAEQNMQKDGYMLFSVNGISHSQTMGTVLSGNIKLSQSFLLEFGSLKIQKVDEKSVGLANAVFDIYQGLTVEGTPQFHNLVSSDNGVIEVSKMLNGYYKIVETQPPLGYNIMPEPQLALIKNGIQDSLRFENTPVDPSETGTIKIFKYNNLGKPLAKAIFNVYYGEDTTLQPYYKDLPSDENGLIIIKNVAPANYTVVETQAPDGYIPLEKGKIITVLSGEESEVGFTNISEAPQQVGGIAIVKTNDKGVPLSGAVFDVFAGSDITTKPVYQNLKTNSIGLIEIANVPIGFYTIVEEKAPDGYYSSKKSLYIEVTVDTVTKVNFENIAIPTYNSRELSISNLFESVALEQAALSHILNAEGEKMQKIFNSEDLSNSNIKSTNKSVQSMINSISKLELILQNKLNLFENCSCESKNDKA